MNTSACDAFGYARDELGGLSLGDLVEDPSAVGALTEADETMCGGGARTVEVTARRRDGRTLPVEARVGLLEGRTGRTFMTLMRDVSEREHDRRRIEYLSDHDELTELPNCRFFASQVEEAVERAGRSDRHVAVLHVDLNRFSLVNQGSAQPEGTSSCARPPGAHGFSLAIDDFGTGHSSFGRLSELPCQVLKIDRTFVARLPDDARAASMVTAMLELADRLGMRAVAEGIETVEQLEFLTAHRCPLGQGFLFSRPVPAEEVARL